MLEHTEILSSINRTQTYEDVDELLHQVCGLLPNGFGTVTFRDQDNTASLDPDILKFTNLENISGHTVEVYDERYQSNDSMVIAEREQRKSCGSFLGRDKFDSYLESLDSKFMLNSSFYNDFLLPLGVNDSVVLNLFSAGSRVARLNIYFDSTDKSKEQQLNQLNFLAPALRQTLSLAYFNDDQFREMIREKEVITELIKMYSKLTPFEARAIYLWATKAGTSEQIAKDYTNRSAKTLINQKTEGVRKIRESLKDDSVLRSVDRIVQLVAFVESKIQSSRLLKMVRQIY